MDKNNLVVTFACTVALAIVCHPQSREQIVLGAQVPLILFLATPIVSHGVPFLIKRYAPQWDEQYCWLVVRAAVHTASLVGALGSAVSGSSGLSKRSLLAFFDSALASVYVVASNTWPALAVGGSRSRRPSLAFCTSTARLFAGTLLLAAAFACVFVQLAPEGPLNPDNGCILTLVTAIAVVEVSALHTVPWQDQVAVGVAYGLSWLVMNDTLRGLQGAAMAIAWPVYVIAILAIWTREERLRACMYLLVVSIMSYCVAAGVVSTQWIRLMMM